MVLCPAGEIGVAHLGLAPAPSLASAPVGPLPRFVDNERAYLEALMEQSGGRLYGEGGAAETAGLKPTTLRSKLVKHGLR